MKSILMNSGDTRWDDVDHQFLSDQFKSFCETVFARGHGTHPDGDMDVRFKADREAGWKERDHPRGNVPVRHRSSFRQIDI